MRLARYQHPFIHSSDILLNAVKNPIEETLRRDSVIFNFSMNIRSSIAFLGVLLTSLAVAPLAVGADVPASKCVTAATEAMHASATTQMNKDIAAHKGEAKAADAMSAYQKDLDTAWEAMESPYCGYGAYGAASAIHSYQKSIARIRAAFLAELKGGPKMIAPTVTVPAVQPKPITPAMPVKTAKTVKQATASSLVRSGLRRGMRSSAVTALQTALAKHFGSGSGVVITGYFGSITEKFVTTYQLEKKIIPSKSSSAAGLVGPRTAAALNAE
jgi:hypothetical protein